MNIDKNREFKEKIIDNDFNLEFQFTEIVKYISNLQQENTQLKMQIDDLIKKYTEDICFCEENTNYWDNYKGKLVSKIEIREEVLKSKTQKVNFEMFIDDLFKLKEVDNAIK